MARTKDSGPSTPFGNVLATREPDAIQGAMYRVLEETRLERIAATPKSMAEDRGDLEKGLRSLADRVPEERLVGVIGLMGLMGGLEAEAKAAVGIAGRTPVVPKDGWLATGTVRDADGSPACGAQVQFRSGDETVANLLKPVAVGDDGRASLSLDARTVAQIVKAGEVEVLITAQLKTHTATDITPARIAPNTLHQFDLVLAPSRKA